MPSEIRLSRSDYKAMLQQLSAALPLEACGLLAGQANHVQRLYPVRNISNSPVRYEMDPVEQLAAMIDLEERGLELLAIYHSHPSGPNQPSAVDLALANYPEVAYVIVSFLQRERPQVRAFTIQAGQAEEISFLVV